jgi:hypothetical protein
MDFWRAVLGLARSRLFGPPVILLSIAVGAIAYSLTPAHYVASAFMVLTTPTSGGSLEPDKPNAVTNPLLQFNDGLKTTAGILIQSMNTPEVWASLGAPKKGPTKITIDDGSTNPDLLGTSTTGPFIFIEVDARTPAKTTEVLERAQRHLRSELLERQKTLSAPQSTFIRVTDVVPASAPEVSRTSKWQVGGAATVLCAVAAFGLALAVDRFKHPRRPGSASAAPPAGRSAMTSKVGAHSHLPGVTSGGAGAAVASARPGGALSRTSSGSPASSAASAARGSSAPRPPKGQMVVKADGIESTGGSDASDDGASDDTTTFVVVVDDAPPPAERDEEEDRSLKVVRKNGKDKPRGGKGEAGDRVDDVRPRAG